MKTQMILILLGILGQFSAAKAGDSDAREIVRKAETKFNGEQSSYSEMILTIVRPAYERRIEFKTWAEQEGNSLTLITAPAKEKGQSFLKSGNNLWSWNPTIQRLIKLPPSMMAQGWMGSDYSNDDILRESSLVRDFTHHLKSEETIDGYPCYVVELLPLENSDVLWGKIVLWITKDSFLELQSEYYDEEGFRVKTHRAHTLKTFDQRLLPSVMEIIPADEPGSKTLVSIQKMQFNIPMAPNFFSQQNMKQIR